MQVTKLEFEGTVESQGRESRVLLAVMRVLIVWVRLCCSFVQEFVDSAVDGVSLLLELLRTVQLQQQGGGAAGQRQALLQENACLQCLHGCLRCPDAPRRLAVSSAGLFTLAVSTMSSVNKSRVLALQVWPPAPGPAYFTTSPN